MAHAVKHDRNEVQADYDAEADVLYLSKGAPRPSEGEERPQGVILRFGMADDSPSGVTIVGYRRHGWNARQDELAKIVSAHIGARSAVSKIISDATG